MKILLASLAVCTLFTGCLPPPGPRVVVAPGHPHRVYHPYGYRYEPTVVVREPYRRHDEVVIVNRHAPAPRYEVAGRPPFHGARWIPGKWVWEYGTWQWHRGHWVHRY